MRRLSLALTVAAGCTLWAGLSAQQINGTGSVSGIVVTSDQSPQPVRRAVVTVRGPGANGRSSVTDDRGRFSIGGLLPGRFTIVASKPAHITNAYGAKGAGRPGTPVNLAAGQALPGLTIVLPRGAAVSGAVRDKRGEPLVNAQVYVERVDGPAAQASWVPDALTDDRGEYRVYGLVPGAYIVAAVVPVSTGGPVNLLSSAEMDTAFQAQQARVTRGGTAAAVSSLPSRVVNYTPIFHPGTPIGTEAARLTLAAGDDRQGIDVTLDLVPVATVSGTVSSPSGMLAELNYSLIPAGPAVPNVFNSFPTSSETPGPNGSTAFTFTNVAPGHYTLKIVSRVMPMRWALAEVDVMGTDVGGLSLQLQPSISLGGRVSFDGVTHAAPSDLKGVHVSLVGMVDSNAGAAAPRAATLSSTARDDGTFRVTGAVPGRYAIGGSVPGAMGPAGWWLRSAVLNGRDLLDAPVELGPPGLADVVLTFSDRHTEIAGTLQSASGVPTPEYFIIAMPANASLWTPGSRRVRMTRPASDGRFSFADLPPGEYILAALTDVLNDEWQDRVFLESIATSGGVVRVTLGEGEKKMQNLKVS